METNDALEALPRLYGDFKSLLKPGDAALRRTIDAWITSMAQRTFPQAIIPEEVNLQEAPMLEETMIKWRDDTLREGRQEGRKEGRKEGRLQATREMLLELMTQRFGRLSVTVRRQIEEISSVQELRKLGRKALRVKSLEEMRLG